MFRQFVMFWCFELFANVSPCPWYVYSTYFVRFAWVCFWANYCGYDLFVINKAIAVEVLKNGKVVTTVTRKEWEPAYKKDGGQMTPPKDRSLGWTESVELDEAMVTSTGKTISYKDGPYTGEVIKKGKIVRTETDLEFNELAKFIKDYANRGRKVNIKDNKGRTVHTESVELDEAKSDFTITTTKNKN